MNELASIVEMVRQSKGIAHKRDIELGMRAIAQTQSCETSVLVGDDCAVIPSGEGYLLFAIEGFMNEFVQEDPWFAGYCGVMVNVSDIAAMGGRATAVVDALWCSKPDQLALILQGMACASARYRVPIVGGHTNARTDRNQLAVSILGSAKSILSSFEAQPGDALMCVIDTRGEYRGNLGNNWNASTDAPADRLRGDLELLPLIAESGLASACKDISMAGPLGTLLMLLECSGCGAEIDPEAFPRPKHIGLERWMQTFPSYGFVFSVSPSRVEEMKHLFGARELQCLVVGQVTAGSQVWLANSIERELLWDFSTTALLGCSALNSAGEMQGVRKCQ
ncbi:sll0787 family AIR synthase-like protein [Limnobacter litoralis]|uniref:Methanogenesis marker 2 protein n=1 Tax=Limnobacter litoralis TaxID=481366 RepID=A0ABQ5YVG5_9BURK|nr:sll0787 family AIR synthase-like protein [Limnobacter litoralis]GLR27472.1 methanogenesis marker 2 protein [Limnobacter litoralis]